MNYHPTRRALLLIGAMLDRRGRALPAFAQDKPMLRFSAVFSEQDIRAEMMKMFADGIKGDFTFEPYYGGTLFKQGTELVALQRGNLEMGNIAPQDISKQIPAWSILTSAYLFRDAAHLKTFFDSELGAEMKKMAEDQLGVHILGPTYFGARQVGLKPTRRSRRRPTWPASSCACPAATPGSSSARRSAPTRRRWPMPRSIPGLQTGAIDGQDNPLPNVENMKFYEVMSQIVLTSHLVGFDLLTVSSTVWNAHGRRRSRPTFQAAADKAHRLEHREAPRARSGAGRDLQGKGPQDLRARRRRLPQLCAGEVPRVRPGQELAGGHGRQDQRALIEASQRSGRRRPHGGRAAAAVRVR